MSNSRVIYVHGNGTTHWSFGWAPWLKQQLEAAGYETFFETMPDSVIARGGYWLPFLEEIAKVGPNDVIVGWSSGAVAAMRYAETHKIKGSVLISPSYTDMGDDLEKQSGYYDTPWDWDAIKANQHSIKLIYGEDDPFIPQDQFGHIAAMLEPEVFNLDSGGHFIDRTEFPGALNATLEILQSVSDGK